MEGELNEGLDYLEWPALRSGGIAKEVAGGIINNGESRNMFLAGDHVEEYEVNIKVSTCI